MFLFFDNLLEQKRKGALVATDSKKKKSKNKNKTATPEEVEEDQDKVEEWEMDDEEEEEPVMFSNIVACNDETVFYFRGGGDDIFPAMGHFADMEEREDDPMWAECHERVIEMFSALLEGTAEIETVGAKFANKDIAKSKLMAAVKEIKVKYPKLLPTWMCSKIEGEEGEDLNEGGIKGDDKEMEAEDDCQESETTSVDEADDKPPPECESDDETPLEYSRIVACNDKNIFYLRAGDELVPGKGHFEDMVDRMTQPKWRNIHQIVLGMISELRKGTAGDVELWKDRNSRKAKFRDQATAKLMLLAEFDKMESKYPDLFDLVRRNATIKCHACAVEAYIFVMSF